MTYYVVDTTNGDSLFFDTDKIKLQSSIRKFKPDLQGQDIQETEREIVLLNNKYVFADEHQETIAEQEELSQLTKETQELESTLNELKSMYTQAQMIGDTETMEEISNTTKKLLGLTEETNNGTEE